MDYLAMKTDPAMDDQISTDINELKVAAKKLFGHAARLGGIRFGTTFLKWTASAAAM